MSGDQEERMNQDTEPKNVLWYLNPEGDVVWVTKEAFMNSTLPDIIKLEKFINEQRPR